MAAALVARAPLEPGLLAASGLLEACELLRGGLAPITAGQIAAQVAVVPCPFGLQQMLSSELQRSQAIMSGLGPRLPVPLGMAFLALLKAANAQVEQATSAVEQAPTELCPASPPSHAMLRCPAAAAAAHSSGQLPHPGSNAASARGSHHNSAPQVLSRAASSTGAAPGAAAAEDANAAIQAGTLSRSSSNDGSANRMEELRQQQSELEEEQQEQQQQQEQAAMQQHYQQDAQAVQGGCTYEDEDDEGLMHPGAMLGHRELDGLTDEEGEGGEEAGSGEEEEAESPMDVFSDSRVMADLYDRLGGWDVLCAAVMDMYERLFSDPLTHRFFAATDKSKLMKHMTCFIGSAMSGKCMYTPRRIWQIHAHMIRAMGLTPEHVDRMGDHLRVVLSDLGINNFEVERILHSLSSMRWVFAISDNSLCYHTAQTVSVCPVAAAEAAEAAAAAEVAGHASAGQVGCPFTIPGAGEEEGHGQHPQPLHHPTIFRTATTDILPLIPERWSEVNSSSVDSLVHRTSMPLPTRGSAPHHQSSGELLSNESSFCCGPQDLSQAGGGGLTARSSMSDASGTQGAFPQAGVGAGAGALGQGPHPQRRSASSSQVTFQGCPHLSKCPSASGRTSAHKAVARSRSSHTGIASRASGGVAQHQHHARLSPRASASADPLGASSGASGHPSAPHGQGLYRMLSEGSQLQAQLLAMWQTASASESAPSRGAGAVGAGVAAGAGGGKALAAPTAPQPLLPLLHQAGEEQAAGSGAGGFLVQPHLVSMVAAPALAARHALMHQPLSRVDEVASGLCINSSGSDSGTLPSLLSSPVKLPPGAGEGPSGVGAAASGALAGGLQLPKMVVPPPAQPVLRPATPSPQKQQAEDDDIINGPEDLLALLEQEELKLGPFAPEVQAAWASSDL